MTRAAPGHVTIASEMPTLRTQDCGREYGNVTLPPVQRRRELACPSCRVEAPRSEWVVVFRRLTGFNARLPTLRVLKHRPCKQMVYFLVE